MNTIAVKKIQKEGCEPGEAMCFPVKELNAGNKRYNKQTESNIAKKAKSNASPKNCAIRLLRVEPTTFLNPTSFARLADFAVDRFMKLIHAITRINTAIAPNNHTNFISPFSRRSSILAE